MAVCNCCGCVLVDGTTSVVSGSGSSGDPYSVEVIDPMFASQRYAVRRQRTTNQPISNDVLTAIDFTAEAAGNFDRGGFFAPPSYFVAPVTGMYIFGATVAFADNAAGTRYIDIVKNDATILTAMESNSNAGAVHFVTTSSSAPLNANETLTLRVRHTAGVVLDVVVNGDQSPVFWAIYVGRFE